MKSFTIPGELISLNEYVNAERSNKFAASSIKKKQTMICQVASMDMDPIEDCEYPIRVEIIWYVKTKRKDGDNIAFAKKFILDGMVCSGVLKNDSMKYICSFNDRFIYSPDEPKIHVIIHTNHKENG